MIARYRFFCTTCIHLQATTFLPAFLFAMQIENRFDAICSGCGDCSSCTVDKNETVSTCSDVFEHSTSPGGSNATLMTLEIEAGYWRATNDSTKVLECYNEDACNGGLTGSDDYCSEGYKGPCEIPHEL